MSQGAMLVDEVEPQQNNPFPVSMTQGTNLFQAEDVQMMSEAFESSYPELV